MYDSMVCTVKKSYLLQLSVALYTFANSVPDRPVSRNRSSPHARSSPIRLLRKVARRIV